MKTTSTFRLKYFLPLIFILFITSNSFGQWQQVGGLFGEPIYYLRSTSTNLYGGTLNGVVTSTNSGSSWAIEPDLYLTNTTEKISTSGDTIVVFAYPQSYLSLDNGVSFTEIDEPAGGSVSVTDMISEDGILYAATAGDYLFRSTDWGVNWTPVTTGLTSSFLYEVDAYDNIVFVNTDDGLFRSTDSGLTFAPASIILPAMQFTQVYTNGTYVFAAVDVNIYKSSNMGLTWVPFDSPLAYSEVTDFVVSGGSVFAASFNMLMKSDLTTANWTEVNFNQNIDFCFSICDKGSVIYAGTNRGVYSSADNGLTWLDVNNGIVPVFVEGLAVLQNYVFAGASIYGVSYHDNSNWTFSGIPLFNCFDLFTEGNDIYSASDYGIWKSADTGQTWNILSPVNTPLPSYVAKVVVSDSLILGAAIQNGVLRSGDYGVTWTVENTGLSFGAQVSSLTISGSNIIAGTYNDGIYTSTDAGFTWSQTAGAGDFISDVTALGSNVFAASYGLSGNYLSTDNGLTWNNVTSNVYDDVTTAGNLIIANAPGYIEISRDSGLTFQDNTPGPSGTFIVSNTASSTDIYIGTTLSGVWKASISEILAISEPAAQFEEVKIIPNIFSSDATIIASTKLIAQTPVLNITDLAGKIVKQIKLYNERTPISADGLAPGIYLYSTNSKNDRVSGGKIIIY